MHFDPWLLADPAATHLPESKALGLSEALSKHHLPLISVQHIENP